LRFPVDRSVGELTITSAGERETRPAQGDVEVPAAASVLLQTHEGVSAVRDLPSDSLSGLLASGVASGELDAVRRQAALTTLVLQGSFTDAEVAALPALGSATMLTLASSDVTGTCFTNLTPPESATFTCWLPAMSQDGLAAMLELRVENMRGQADALNAELLDTAAEIGARNLLMGARSLDLDALVRLLERSSRVSSIHLLQEDEGEPDLLDEAAVLELRRRFPALSINGSWLAPGAVERLSAADAQPLVVPDGIEPAEPLVLTADGFDAIITGDTPVLVDFTATWCGPCKALKPTIDQITGELADRLVVGTLDIDDHKPIADRYGISAIPALLVFANGEQVARLAGRDKDALYGELAAVLS
jgi:thioredoxin 1